MGGTQIRLEHAADKELGQRRPGKVVEQLANRLHQVGTEDLRGADPVQDEGPPFGQLERLAQQLPEIVHLHAAVTQRLGERVVLLLRPPGPHHLVKQQVLDVLRGEPGQFQARPVHDDLAELPHL